MILFGFLKNYDTTSIFKSVLILKFFYNIIKNYCNNNNLKTKIQKFPIVWKLNQKFLQ